VIHPLLADPRPVVGKAHAAEFGAVIGEEIGNGDIPGLAADVQDAGVGKEQLDQADVLKVVGQFVHHPQRIRGIGLQGFEQSLGIALALGLGEIPEAVGIGQAAAQLPFPGLHAGDLLTDLAQLTGAMHLAMAAQDLLGERGAGARHAQHKHRQR
jgi:hypothetical protein